MPPSKSFSRTEISKTFANTSQHKKPMHAENGMRVLVYQYHTLYTEVFIIHDDYDLRRN